MTRSSHGHPGGTGRARSDSPAPSGVISLGIANALALAAAVGATALYARWLDAQTFGHWALALALARAGLVLLDGGLKTALVRRAEEPDADTYRRLTRWCAAAALALSVVAAAVLAWMASRAAIDRSALLLVAAYAAAYWWTYPPLLPALARLERAQRFGVVGRAEGASVAIEFALPALAIAGGGDPTAAFIAGAVLGRAVRAGWLCAAQHALPRLPAQTAGTGDAAPVARAWLKDGSGVQAISALSMLRDQLHLWLLAPAFGAAVAGQYALALTACALASQVAVATATRVLLPRFRAASAAAVTGEAADAAACWPLVLAQTRALAMLALPALALLPAWVGGLNAGWWDSRWTLAVALLPWLALRMVAGVGTTVVGAWLMAVRSPWAGAAAHARWAVFEAALAAAALAIAGPLAMAAAMSASVWLGLWWMLRAAEPAAAAVRLRALAVALLGRPSLAGAIGLALCVQAAPGALWAATLLLPLVWLLEAPVRRWLRARWLRPAGAGAW